MTDKISNTGERLLEMLHYFDIRMIDMCTKINLASSTLSCYVSGKRTPKADTIHKISNAYGVNPIWLLGYDEPMFISEPLFDAGSEYDRKFRSLSERDQRIVKALIDSMVENHFEQTPSTVNTLR